MKPCRNKTESKQAERAPETVLPAFVSMDFILGSAHENPRGGPLRLQVCGQQIRLDKIKLFSKGEQKSLVFWTGQIKFLNCVKRGHRVKHYYEVILQNESSGCL